MKNFNSLRSSCFGQCIIRNSNKLFLPKERFYCIDINKKNTFENKFNIWCDSYYENKRKIRFGACVLTFGALQGIYFGTKIYDKYNEYKIILKEHSVLHDNHKIREDGNYIKEIPEEKRTEKMYELAIKNGASIYCLPKDQRTIKIETEYIKKEPSYLKEIRIDKRTQKMCEIAFKRNPNSIEYFPLDFKTQTISKIAFKHDVRNFQFIPDSFKTQNMSEIAFKHNVKNFQFIPDSFKTQNMSEIAFKHDIINFQFIPDSFKTDNMCMEAVNKNTDLFGYVPSNMKTVEMYKKVFDKNPNFISSIPKDKITKEMAIIVCKNQISNWKYIPNEIKDQLKNMKLNELGFDTSDMNIFSGEIFTGKQFNEWFGHNQFIKYTNAKEKHNRFRYLTGSNKLIEKFRPKGTASKGGFYFAKVGTDEEWRRNQTYYRIVTIPDSALVYIEPGNKLKTNLFILSERKLIADLKIIKTIL